MATLREFVTKWGFDVDESQLKKLDRTITKTQKNLRATARVAIDLGKKMTLGITLPIVGLGALSLKAASDAEETFSKFGTVFKDVGKSAEETANNLAKNFGLAQDKARQLLGDTGDLLTGFGFTGEAALELSKRTNELAVDLASFTNVEGGAERASKALTKALLGERESVKELGIAILESDVKAKVKALQAAGRFTDETEREKKAIATLDIALGQSKNAIGDYARTKESLANQTRELLARVRDLSISFGQLLIPMAKRVNAALIPIVNAITGLSKRARIMILIFAGVAASIGPLLIIFGLMTHAILAMRTAMLLMGGASLKVFALLLLKFAILAAAIIAVAT